MFSRHALANYIFLLPAFLLFGASGPRLGFEKTLCGPINRYDDGSNSSILVSASPENASAQDESSVGWIDTRSGDAIVSVSDFMVRIGSVVPLPDGVFVVKKLHSDNSFWRRSNVVIPGQVGGMRKDCIQLQKIAYKKHKIDANSIFLQDRPGGLSLYIVDGPPEATDPHNVVHILLDRILSGSNGRNKVILAWQYGPLTSWNASGTDMPSKQLPLNYSTLKPGDVLDLPDVGRVRLAKIVPQVGLQPEWLVLQPDTSKKQLR